MDDFIEVTELEGVLLIKRPVYKDDRGFFREIFRKNELEAKIGQQLNFVQANHSRSSKGTLRGIHIAPWSKLVTVLSGQVQQVVVDLRPGSKTFGKYTSFVLGEDNFAAVYFPGHCGNAFLTLSETADYMYVVTDYWAPGKELAVRYDDPNLAIKWQNSAPLLSEKDTANPLAKEVYPEKF